MFTLCSQSHKIERLTCAWLPLFFIPLWEMAVLFAALMVIEYLQVLPLLLRRLIVSHECYIFPVVLTFECPSRFDTVFNGAPLAISKVAFVCLRLCMEHGGRSLRCTKL